MASESINCVRLFVGKRVLSGDQVVKLVEAITTFVIPRELRSVNPNAPFVLTGKSISGVIGDAVDTCICALNPLYVAWMTADPCEFSVTTPFVFALATFVFDDPYTT